MSEELLYKLWASKSILRHDLRTSQGKKISILKIGKRNLYSGPDFEDAIVQIEGIVWHGSVEVHVNSSDWILHKHHQDPAYSNVILHVVWKEDKPIEFSDGTTIPCLILSQFIINPSKYLPHFSNEFACQDFIKTVPESIKLQMKKKCLSVRLEQKSKIVENIWLASDKDWEETIYRTLAQAMGFHQNAQSMLRLASSIPLKMLWKYRETPLRMEALLFGQAGLLDEYPIKEDILAIKNEFEFLKHKHQLSEEYLQKSNWKYFKLRPPNYPNIRIYELAQLLRSNLSLLTFLLEIQDLKNLKLFFESHRKEKRVAFGDQAFKSIVINGIIPILIIYTKEKNEKIYQEKAMTWLIQLKPEGHGLEKSFHKIGLEAKNAADSQAFIQWKKNYCEKEKCSICEIGKFVFNKG